VGDAPDNCEAEAGSYVVGVHALGPALERLCQRGNGLWGELLAGVHDGEHDGVGLTARGDPDRAPFGQVVHDGVVHQVRRQLEQERR
jgi:hypothetical protein